MAKKIVAADFDPLTRLETLAAIEKRILWLATRIIDYANHDRPAGEVKVGGHQASSASMASSSSRCPPRSRSRRPAPSPRRAVVAAAAGAEAEGATAREIRRRRPQAVQTPAGALKIGRAHV